jgi:hypothetical protein
VDFCLAPMKASVLKWKRMLKSTGRKGSRVKDLEPKLPPRDPDPDPPNPVPGPNPDEPGPDVVPRVDPETPQPQKL